MLVPPAGSRACIWERYARSVCYPGQGHGIPRHVHVVRLAALERHGVVHEGAYLAQIWVLLLGVIT